jgi:hypothetical protein
MHIHPLVETTKEGGRVQTRSSSSPELVSPWDQIQLKFNISRKYLKISSGRVQLAGVACLRWMSPLAASKEFNKADLLQRPRSASSLSLGALFPLILRLAPMKQ